MEAETPGRFAPAFGFYRDDADYTKEDPRTETLDALCEIVAARLLNSLLDLNADMREHFNSAVLSDDKRARLSGLGDRREGQPGGGLGEGAAT